MPKNIVVCSDGTNNEIVNDETNVLRLFRMLRRGEDQAIFYNSGVGTQADPTVQWWWRRRVAKSFDAAVGLSIRHNVLNAYRYLMSCYEDGDAIYLFGFSRGAYTVRALAGMIYRCGLLCPEYQHLAEYCWSVFSDEDHTGDRHRIFGGSARIKKVFGREVKIHFVGVWDTVSTFGWIWDLLTVPNSDKNPDISHCRQALAIDERRSCFQPIRFDVQPGQTCQEVWFPGVHADVGGGYPAKCGGLARISLEWMLNEAVMVGLKIERDKVKEQLDTLKDIPVACEDAKMHDESVRRGWRIQGWFPKRSFDKAKKMYRWTWPNRARTRPIHEGADIHEAATKRMANAYLKYQPQLPATYKTVKTIACPELAGLLRESIG